MFDLLNLFNKKENILTKEEAAELLKTTPEALEAFESAYKLQAAQLTSDNFFDIDAKTASAALPKEVPTHCPDELIDRIVNELLGQTQAYIYRDGVAQKVVYMAEDAEPVTLEELHAIPVQDRPFLSGNVYKRDMEGSYEVLLSNYKGYLTAKSPSTKKMYYDLFRQGLDILDLDPIIYEMLGMNQNSMGVWLPPLVEGIQKQEFFKVPNTTVIRVPITLLQLTRLQYEEMTPATIKILDRYCMKAFDLDVSKDYFIKTGTYSSKFDFRNACVRGEKEVRELGEYLLFIHYQACMMAAPLSTPSIYGVSTTNEWVVREYIEDKKGLPTIYKGMPLRTEYRVFVDFDTGKILGMNPYWDPAVMKQRFGHGSDANSPHQIHDYVIYQMREEPMMKEYESNKDIVRDNIQAILPNIPLRGQWSIDVMQDGDDFYVIDMALAYNSALKECVPKGLLKVPKENWIPNFSELN